MIMVCDNCRFKNRSILKEPCHTGAYQLAYSHRCYLWKKRRLWQRIADRISSAGIYWTY